MCFKNYIPGLLIGLLITASASAQRITKNEIKALEKNNSEQGLLADDADFTAAKTAPEKWNTESAVILAHKTSFEFDRKTASAGMRIGRNIMGIFLAPFTLGTSVMFANMNLPNSIIVEERERRKILVQDKFATDMYAVVYFRAGGGDAFAAQVIKKDGTVEKVDFADAARVQNIGEVPAAFKGYTDQKASSTYRTGYFKLAVPNLEEGDIIEYELFHINSQQYLGAVNYKEFDPIYYLCNRELPVAKQVIEVTTDEKNFMGYRALRGSSDFTMTQQGEKKTYRWLDADREKLKDTRYVNEFVELPAIKFQVIYASNRKQDFIWFKDADALKRSITTEELTERAKQFWFKMDGLNNMSTYSDGVSKTMDQTIKEMYKRLKYAGATDQKPEDFIRNAYYMIRSYTVMNEWHDFAFARILSGLMEKQEIEHDIAITTSSYRTTLSDIAFNREIVWGIRCNGKYYFNPGEHGNPGEINSALTGNQAIVFAASEKSKSTPETVVLPLSDTAMNVTATNIEVSLDTALTAMTVKKDVEITGLNKEAEMDDVLALTTFLESDYRNYGGMGMWDNYPSMGVDRLRDEWNARKKDWRDEKPKMMKALAEQEYNHEIKNYDNFKLVQDGRSMRKQSLKYTENFVLDEMVARAGNDLIVSMPMLVGAQVRIRKEERQRTSPINFNNAKAFKWNISFAIPAGYTAVGLENLNQRTDNETGAFISTATLNGNTVTISATKLYKSKYFDTNNWGSVLKFLDAAYKFSQAKIVLKKV